MGLLRNPSLRSEEYLQLAFAIYATFLLYYMSPSVDLRTKPDFTWATKLAKQWKNFIVQPRIFSALQESSVIQSQMEVCEDEKIDFEQKKSNDEVMIRLKRELYDEILEFQKKNSGSESLAELMKMKSQWSINGPKIPKITVILNHFKRRTLCAQLNSLLNQTLPFHHVWVLSFGSPNELSLRRIVESYNDSRISFVSSSYDFKYYGRFQLALQAESDFVYIVDDDMIPFRQKDFTFPSYRKFRTKESGLYLPDPAYDITVERIVQVDFLSSSWFLSSDLVKTLFVETPFTFMTGEDLLIQMTRKHGEIVSTGLHMFLKPQLSSKTSYRLEMINGGGRSPWVTSLSGRP